MPIIIGPVNDSEKRPCELFVAPEGFEEEEDAECSVCGFAASDHYQG
jgi:hypothetical protein